MRTLIAMSFLMLTTCLWTTAAGADPGGPGSRWSWYVSGGSAGDLDGLADETTPPITADSLLLNSEIHFLFLEALDANFDGVLDSEEFPVELISTKVDAANQVGLGGAYCFNQHFSLDFGLRYGTAGLTRMYTAGGEIDLLFFDVVAIPIEASLESDVRIFSGHLAARFYPWSGGRLRPWLSAGLRGLSFRPDEGLLSVTSDSFLSDGRRLVERNDSSIPLSDVEKLDPFAGLGVDLKLGDLFDLTVAGEWGLDLEWSAGVRLVWKVGGDRCRGCPPESWPPRPADWSRLEPLVGNGVTIATLARSFSFEGPVKGEEPLVVDFRLAGSGRLELGIWRSGAKRPVILEFRGAGARRFDKARLPRKLGDDWQTARFSFRALDASGKPIDFEMFGVGVGKRAVGSTGIYDVTFEPFVIRAAESADWEFWSHHDFERSEIVLYRQAPAAGELRENLAHAFDGRCLPRRGESCQGGWDGRDEAGGRSPGRYRLAVKAWQEATLDKDWIIGWSEDEVEVQ